MAGRDLGRGALFIPLAKVWFVVTSFAINFGLPNLLSADGVGDYGVVNRVVGLVNMVMIAGTIQAIAKFVAEDPNRAGGLRKWALGAQVLFGGGVSLLLFVLAEPLAGLFNDPSLARYFRIVAWIPLFYGLYAVQIGVFNGKKDFRSQAAFDIGYAALRATGILGAAAMGYGVAGVFGAFAAAAAVVMLVALLVGRRTTVGPMGVTAGEVITFAAPVMALVLVSQWLLSFDLFWLKALLPEAISSFESGAYFSMLNLALVPYMLVLSVNFIVFPLVSRSTFDEDGEATRGYIRQSLRVAFLLTVAMEVVLLASPEHAVGMVYPSKPEYAELAGALRILAPGYVALCLFGISTAIVNGAGRPLVSFAAGLTALALQGGLCWAFIPRWGMLGAAAASAIAFTLGAAILAAYQFRTWGAWLPLATIVRGAVAGLVCFGFGAWAQWTGVRFLAEAMTSAALFLGTLWLLREIGAEDVRHLRRLAGHSADTAR